MGISSIPSRGRGSEVGMDGRRWPRRALKTVSP